MPIQQKSLSMPETEAISNAEILRIDDELWEQLIELTELDNSTLRLGHMLVGVRAAEHFVGTFGVLQIDELAVLR